MTAQKLILGYADFHGGFLISEGVGRWQGKGVDWRMAAGAEFLPDTALDGFLPGDHGAGLALASGSGPGAFWAVLRDGGAAGVVIDQYRPGEAARTFSGGEGYFSAGLSGEAGLRTFAKAMNAAADVSKKAGTLYEALGAYLTAAMLCFGQLARADSRICPACFGAGAVRLGDRFELIDVSAPPSGGLQ